MEAWALAGVILGFVLGEASHITRRWFAMWCAKRNLAKELQTLLGVIPQKRHIIQQARDALRDKGILPTSGVPASRLGYDVYFVAALPLLSRVSRACLHNMYERMIWNDRFLDGFKDEIVTAIRDGIIDDPYAEYAGRLEEVDASYSFAAELIRGYLAGDPEDIYPETEVANLDPPEQH